MSLNRYLWLMRTRTSNSNETIWADFLENRFARIWWLVAEFENNTWEYYRPTEFFCDKWSFTKFLCLFLQLQFYSIYERQGRKGWNFILCISWCERPVCLPGDISRGSPINNPKENENAYDLVTEISKNIFNTGMNMTGDRRRYYWKTLPKKRKQRMLGQ